MKIIKNITRRWVAFYECANKIYLIQSSSTTAKNNLDPHFPTIFHREIKLAEIKV